MNKSKLAFSISKVFCLFDCTLRQRTEMPDSGDTSVHSKRVSVFLPKFRFGRQIINQQRQTNPKRAKQRGVACEGIKIKAGAPDIGDSRWAYAVRSEPLSRSQNSF